MKNLINILLIILAVVLQISLLPQISFLTAFPNLIFLIMLSLVFINRPESLWWLGGGILLDLVSPFRFGLYTISLVVVFLLANYLVNHIFSDPSLFIAAVFFFVGSIILNAIFLLLTSQFSLLFFEVIYSTFVGCIIYGLIRYYLKPKEVIKI